MATSGQAESGSPNNDKDMGKKSSRVVLKDQAPLGSLSVTHYRDFSFLKLPYELREMIYKYCLITEKYIKPSFGVGKTVYHLDCDRVQEKRVEWGTVLPQDKSEPTSTAAVPFRSTSLASPISTTLLKVNRQVREESSRIVFSCNKIHLVLGTAAHYPHTDRVCANPFPHTYLVQENFSHRPMRHLRYMRACVLEVNSFSFCLQRGRESHVEYQARLADLAAGLSQGHCLRKFRLEWNPSPLIYSGRLQNVLEPLGMLYGIPKVEVQGTLEMNRGIKLIDAMTSKERVCASMRRRRWNL